MRVRYVNHNNVEYILHGAGHTFTDTLAMRSYDWTFVTTNRPSGMGGTASGFARYPIVRELLIGIWGFTAAAFAAQANELLAVADADVMAGEPGRLYLDNQYIVCYLSVGGSVEAFSERAHFVKKRVRALVVEPYWCTEVSTTYNKIEQQTDTTGKKYDLRYAYRYGSGYSVNTLFNNHYAAAPSVITIYGAVENPSVIIAGNTYNVDVQLAATARLVIDQVQQKIYTVAADGARTNVFNARNKAHDVFIPIPSGANQVLYSGDFKFEITLVQQRSEPLWG